MKILLVQIVNPERGQDAIFPTGLGYIAAYLRREMVGLEAIRIAQHNLYHTVNTFRPDIIGVSTVTQNYERAKQFCAWCKAHHPQTIIVMGGHHISALPGSLTPDMDLAVIGEGEITMLRVCETIRQSGLDWDVLENITGIAYRDPDGILHQTNRRAPISDLDILPFPARDLMHINPGEAIGVITSRGCPYHCVFCASRSFWGNARFHSAEYVVREIETVVEQFGPRHIYLWDDLFVADRKRLGKIVTLLCQKNIPGRVRFSLNCRANLVDQTLVDLLTQMNVFEVSMGLESFDPSTLAYLKDHVTVQDNWRAIHLFDQANIRVMGFFIIGAPHEAQSGILKTLDAFRSANLYRAQAYILTPLPGTPVWEYAQRRNLVSDEMDWDRLYIDAPEKEQNGVVLSEELDPTQVRAWLRKFHRVRRRKERKIKLEKMFHYLQLLFIEPKTVLALARKAWQLGLYRIKTRASKTL